METKEIIKQDKILKFNDLEFNLSDKAQLNNFQETYAKGTSTTELASFIGVIKATGLNPFKKEIWCVKYGNNPAQIFVGRDGYRKVAKSHKDYAGHRVDVVCEKDEFKVKNGQLINHEYSLSNRGKILGAYCIVKVKGQDDDIMHFVDFDEYNTNQSNWKTKPKTMIKKVAEAQTLRMTFDELLEGTYDESEYYENNIKTINTTEEDIESKENELKNKYNSLTNNEKENENI